ncbi:hypothetical protein CKM354_000148000 [Cercospora kikuchii]|uniref:Uncharacterized protein n=1 Tax=Cercospora kikuchii TaxID=84275 RepID=A0A9P3FCR2_9PEZI|nr:uncharacterized protein CKM354_000148000 [Cercospora kikuchii]GIZ38054.1 hypothetical protein CKM354_000148000 [Cercospora kikuchii]
MAATPSGFVTATLNYFLEPEHGGDKLYRAGTAGEKRRKYKEAQVHINDVRRQEDNFILDKHGFQLVKSDTAEKTFDDEQRIQTLYYDECAELIKKVTGASLVKPFGHVVRRLSWKAAYDAEKDLPDDARSVGPSNARFVHCDQSYNGSRERIKQVFPEGSEKLDRCRWAYINVWRPFDYPATRDALCFADYASIGEDEIRPITIQFPKRRDSVLVSDENCNNPGAMLENGERDPYIHGPEMVTSEALQCAAPGTPNQHKWYYASEMKPDEALLLKICDSKKGVANRLFHSSFEAESDYGPDRHSLEVRCAVFFEDQPLEE